jgi:ectoine hydroxylase-related dioxygenase (phytanoyl-CoA dioxygenase family)
MIKPYLKQRIDLPRAIPKEYQKDMSEMAKQKLGYFAQAPTSLEEFYAPIEKRTYSEKSEWDK